MVDENFEFAGPAGAALTANARSLSYETKEFLTSLLELQTLVGKYDFRIRTHSEAAIERFIALPKENQVQIMSGLKQYLDFLSQASLAGIDLRNDGQLLKAFLQNFNFIYDEGIYGTLAPGDVIELYSKDYSQLYRNLCFMNLCSYSLMDLLIYQPYELYERSHQVKDHMKDAVQTIMERPFNTAPLNLLHFPHHMIREKFSSEKLISLVQFKALYPVYTWPQNMFGFLVIQSGQNLREVGPEVSFL